MTTAPHPLFATARTLADGLLAPHAARVDREGCPWATSTRSGARGCSG